MFIFVGIAALLSSLGNTLIKLSSNFIFPKSQIFFILGCFAYALNLIFFKYSLKFLPISTAYPVLAALSILLSTLIAIRFLGESITINSLIGITLICFGIALITNKA